VITLLRHREPHSRVEPGENLRDALVVAVCAILISIVAAQRPSFWTDEAATISAATRPMSELRDLLASIDAVHGLYYLVMHAWFLVFPATEFWARVPSALFIGAAGAGVVVLGRQLSTRAVAITAGMVFAVLPRTTWAGIEARSAAMSIAAAVWVTVLCVAATRRNSPQWWVGYGLAVIAASLVHPFLALLVFAHWLLVTRLAGCRRIVTAWVITVACAGVVVAPYFAFIRTQRSQVDWISPVGGNTLVQVLGDQNFPPVFASRHRLANPAGHVTPEILHAMLLAWALVLPFMAVVAVLGFAAFRRRHTAARYVGPNSRLTIMVAAAWIAVPTVIVVAYSVIGEPLYQPRYLAFTTPAMALLIGIAVVTVARSPQSIALVAAVLMLAAAPNYLAQRLPHSKLGSDYSQVADLVKSRAGAGDCLQADDAVDDMIGRLKAARPDAFRALRDDGEARPPVDADTLFGPRRDSVSWADWLATCPTVWTIAEADAAPSGMPAYAVLRHNGFRVVHRWQFNLTQVIESRR
jgi:mannosyltransferase